MDRDYAGVIKKKLDDVYRTGSSGTGVKSEKESRQAFIVRLSSETTRYDGDTSCTDIAERSRTLLLAYGASH